MAWIRTINEEDATGILARVYKRIAGERGKVSNIMKIQSLHPRAMKAHLDLYVSLMFGESEFTREEREIIATVVSATNHCNYCKFHHGEALQYYWNDREKVNQFIKDYTSVPLSQKMQVVLEYSIKLTKEPGSVDESDIEAMRAQGVSDRGILEVNMITSYFNFVNRLAEGLGVEYSREEIEGYNY